MFRKYELLFYWNILSGIATNTGRPINKFIGQPIILLIWQVGVQFTCTCLFMIV